MTRTYESMLVIDNEAVRSGWREVKASIAALVAKHGGRVACARRWDERRLAYPIRHRRRATYLLAYLEMEPGSLTGLRRELDISETVLRYLILATEGGAPAQELELAAAEEAAGFSVPEPPTDDATDDDERRRDGGLEGAGSEVVPAEGPESRRRGSDDSELAEPVGASRSGSDKSES